MVTFQYVVITVCLKAALESNTWTIVSDEIKCQSKIHIERDIFIVIFFFSLLI